MLDAAQKGKWESADVSIDENQAILGVSGLDVYKCLDESTKEQISEWLKSEQDPRDFKHTEDQDQFISSVENAHVDVFSFSDDAWMQKK